MLNLKRNVRIEYNTNQKDLTSNPIEYNSSVTENLSNLISQIISEEFPMLKNSSMLHDMVLYSLVEKMNTIQTMENVLSYIKESKIKKVNEISFKNGDINIKCSI